MACRAANRYLAELFHIAAAAAGGGGGKGGRGGGGGGGEGNFNYTSRLNRFDLFHGHLWTGACDRYSFRRAVGGGGGGGGGGSGGDTNAVVGLLMHAAEYPAFDESTFPYNLGHCQAGAYTRPLLSST